MHMNLSTREPRTSSLIAVALCLALLPATAGALSESDLVQFPITDASGETVVSTTSFIDLFQGQDYTYTAERTAAILNSANDPDRSDPSTWTILRYTGTVTFLPGGGNDGLGYDFPNDGFDTFVLAFTSLREGDFDGVTLPPVIDGGYVRPAFSNPNQIFIEDPSPGLVTDLEEGFFFGLVFEALPGVEQSFTFEIALRETFDGGLHHFNRGFLSQSVPEPTGLVLTAIGALGALGLGRARGGLP
jgi:hypothetical protein